MLENGNTNLNRSISDSGWAMFISMLRYKAEEAGTKFIEIDTIKAKPSQRCPECWDVKKKLLSERIHHCDICNYTGDRDVVAAQTMVKWYETKGLGTNPLGKGLQNSNSATPALS
jgi:putative transposase